jgi:hypothetical protein
VLVHNSALVEVDGQRHISQSDLNGPTVSDIPENFAEVFQVVQ